VNDPKKPGFRFLAIRHYHIVDQRDWQPALNIYQTDSTLVVVAELAGVERQSLDIEVEPNMLRIQGVRPMDTPDELRRVHRMEIAAGPFQIEAELPVLVNPEQASSHYNNGLLEVVLPLAQRTARRVSIDSTEGDAS
jgi:HSP20 family molecular chaperone IbpA